MTTTHTWKDSSHKYAYLLVAILHLTTPTEVYRIAHSHFLETPREGRICQHLARLGVFDQTKHSA